MGWRQIDEVLREAGREPVLHPSTLRGRLQRGWDPDRARLVLPSRDFDPAAAQRRDAVVLALLRASSGPLTCNQIAHRVGCPYRWAYLALGRLKRRGLVEVSARGGPLAEWHLKMCR